MGVDSLARTIDFELVEEEPEDDWDEDEIMSKVKEYDANGETAE